MKTLIGHGPTASAMATELCGMTQRSGDQILTLTVHMVNFSFLTSKTYFFGSVTGQITASHTSLTYWLP